MRKTQRNYYILLHKPRGYVTTVSDELGRKTVMDLVRDIDARLYPVGRLDKDSEGLLLLTNDGAFANALTHPRHAYSKKYRVTIRGKVDDSALLQLREGIDLDGRMTAPCDVTVLTAEENRTVLEFVLHEGRQPPNPPYVRGSGTGSNPLKAHCRRLLKAGYAAGRKVARADGQRGAKTHALRCAANGGYKEVICLAKSAENTAEFLRFLYGICYCYSGATVV